MTEQGHPFRHRLDPTPAHLKPPLRLPADARLAVWTIVNVEHCSPTGAMPRTVLPPPMGQPLLPDLPNWAWHEYGMRVGFWRILEALQQRGMKATFALNGSAIRRYEEVCTAARDAGWEFMGHGFVQRPMHKVEDQMSAIRDTVETIKQFTGKAPRGWESPGLTETDDTLDYLSANGIEYVADWVIDDLPTWIQAHPKPVLSVPYTVELNDIPLMAIQHHRSDEMYVRGVQQLDRLWKESLTQPRVMAISVHPYITGVPHRIDAFERLLDAVQAKTEVAVMTGEEVADWYRAQVPAPASV